MSYGYAPTYTTPTGVPMNTVQVEAVPVPMQTVAVDPGHHHDTAKGGASGAAAALLIPGIGPIGGAVIGSAIGHHKKHKHQAEAMAGLRSAN